MNGICTPRGHRFLSDLNSMTKQQPIVSLAATALFPSLVVAAHPAGKENSEDLGAPCPRLVREILSACAFL
jgi:hypothetical protein